MSDLKKVIDYLIEENPNLPRMFDLEKLSDFEVYRALVNVRQPYPVPKEILALQDNFLQEIIIKRGVTDADSFNYQNNIALWQGDISSLKIDAIVNAANSRMLGCFYPLHACIDNVIQTYAGIQLRLACNEFMEKQNNAPEQTGLAKITSAFNLPSKYVLHTVGPIISSRVSKHDEELLASSYISCLKLADEYNLSSIAFCCISTGEFRFPQQLAAEIAIKAVKNYLKENNSKIKVVFNVFKDEDKKIYERLLGQN